MQKLFQFVRKYPFSTICIIVIWMLSFLPFFPETPLDDIQFIDKWTHFIMYGGTCTVIWWEYLRKHTILNKQKLFLFAWLAPIVMSGVIELLQEYCTTTRSGEWLDFASNSTGVTVAVVIGLLIYFVKSLNKDPRHDTLS